MGGGEAEKVAWPRGEMRMRKGHEEEEEEEKGAAPLLNERRIGTHTHTHTVGPVL